MDAVDDPEQSLVPLRVDHAARDGFTSEGPGPTCLIASASNASGMKASIRRGCQGLYLTGLGGTGFGSGLRSVARGRGLRTG